MDKVTAKPEIFVSVKGTDEAGNVFNIGAIREGYILNDVVFTSNGKMLTKSGKVTEILYASPAVKNDLTQCPCKIDNDMDDKLTIDGFVLDCSDTFSHDRHLVLMRDLKAIGQILTGEEEPIVYPIIEGTGKDNDKFDSPEVIVGDLDEDGGNYLYMSVEPDVVYQGIKYARHSEPNLLARNIVRGVNICSVEGEFEPEIVNVGTDTTDATISADDVLEGKIAYGADGQIIGNIPSMYRQSFLPSTEEQIIAAGNYIAEDITIKGDEKLLPENIRDGVDIFGITGEYKGTDTSDATVNADDILEGKTAYNKNGKITGTIKSKRAAEITPGTEDIVIGGNQYLEGPQTILGNAWLTPENIKEGVEIFGVEGTVKEMPPEEEWKETETFTPGNEDQIITGQQYLKGDQIIKGSDQLLAENIKEGVSIFDVEGTFKGVDVSDATAVSDDLLPGVTAYGPDGKITGTMKTTEGKTYTPGVDDQIITGGKYLLDDVTIKGDENLKAFNIKAGENIFGVVGSFTNDADATADQLLEGATAYVKGEKVTGTIPTVEGMTITPSASEQYAITDAAYVDGPIKVEGDLDLIPENIKKGVTIFGVEGTNSAHEEVVDAYPVTITETHSSTTDLPFDETVTFTVNGTITSIRYAMQYGNAFINGSYNDPNQTGSSTLSGNRYKNEAECWTSPGGVQGMIKLINANTVQMTRYTNDNPGTLYISYINTVGDDDLVPENIKDGVNIFGVTGTLQEGIDTSDATATSAQMLEGSTAYVNGEKITGTIASKAAAEITPKATDQTIESGVYLDGDQVIKGDPNLVASNIKNGVSLFGVKGLFEGIDGIPNLGVMTLRSTDYDKSTTKVFEAPGPIMAIVAYESASSPSIVIGRYADVKYGNNNIRVYTGSNFYGELTRTSDTQVSLRPGKTGYFACVANIYYATGDPMGKTIKCFEKPFGEMAGTEVITTPGPIVAIIPNYWNNIIGQYNSDDQYLTKGATKNRLNLSFYNYTESYGVIEWTAKNEVTVNISQPSGLTGQTLKLFYYESEDDDNLIPSNIKKGVSINGTVGSYEGLVTTDATVTPSDMLSGVTAYGSEGTKLEGTIESKTAEIYVPTTTDQVISSGVYLSEDQTISGDANLLAENIRDGISLFGIAGSFEGIDGLPNIKKMVISSTNVQKSSDGVFDIPGIILGVVGYTSLTGDHHYSFGRYNKTVTGGTNGTMIYQGTNWYGNITITSDTTVKISGTSGPKNCNFTTEVLYAANNPQSKTIESTTIPFTGCTMDAEFTIPGVIVAIFAQDRDYLIGQYNGYQYSSYYPQTKNRFYLTDANGDNFGYIEWVGKNKLVSKITSTSSLVGSDIEVLYYEADDDPNLLPKNIRKGVTIDGTYGTYEGTVTSDATVTADDLLLGVTAYGSEGTKITGTIESKGAETFTPTTTDQTISSGVYLSEDQIISGDSNLLAENIRAGKSIFGINGIFEGIDGLPNLKKAVFGGSTWWSSSTDKVYTAPGPILAVTAWTSYEYDATYNIGRYGKLISGSKSIEIKMGNSKYGTVDRTSDTTVKVSQISAMLEHNSGWHVAVYYADPNLQSKTINSYTINVDDTDRNTTTDYTAPGPIVGFITTDGDEPCYMLGQCGDIKFHTALFNGHLQLDTHSGSNTYKYGIIKWTSKNTFTLDRTKNNSTEKPSNKVVNILYYEAYDDPNLLPANIKKGISIDGTVGTYEGLVTTDATMTADDLLLGKTGYSKEGTKLTGTIESIEETTITPTTTDIVLEAGKYLAGTQTISGSENLIAANIKKDIDLFGIIGSYEPEVLTSEHLTYKFITFSHRHSGDGNTSKEYSIPEGRILFYQITNGVSGLRNRSYTVIGEYDSPKRLVMVNGSENSVYWSSTEPGFSLNNGNGDTQGTATRISATTFRCNDSYRTGTTTIHAAYTDVDVNDDPYLTPENIRKDIQIFNTLGTLEPLPPEDEWIAATEYIPSTEDQTIAANKYLSGIQTIKGSSNLLAENIKKDIDLFGIIGSYEPEVLTSEHLTYKAKSIAHNVTEKNMLTSLDYTVPGRIIFYHLYGNNHSYVVIGEHNADHCLLLSDGNYPVQQISSDWAASFYNVNSGNTCCTVKRISEDTIRVTNSNTTGNVYIYIGYTDVDINTDPYLVPENIRKDVMIFNTTGTLKPLPAEEDWVAATEYTPTTEDQVIAANQYLGGTQTIKGDANLVASNIKKDTSIFGVTGTYVSTDENLLPENIKKDIEILGVTGTYESNELHFSVYEHDGVVRTNLTSFYQEEVAIDGTILFYQLIQGENTRSVIGERGSSNITVISKDADGYTTSTVTEEPLVDVPCGSKNAGLMASRLGKHWIRVTHNTYITEQCNYKLVIGYTTSNVINDPDLVPGNIKKDVDILGVVGTYEPAVPETYHHRTQIAMNDLTANTDYTINVDGKIYAISLSWNDGSVDTRICEYNGYQQTSTNEDIGFVDNVLKIGKLPSYTNLGTATMTSDNSIVVNIIDPSYVDSNLGLTIEVFYSNDSNDNTIE